MWSAVVFGFRTLLRKPNYLPDSVAEAKDPKIVKRSDIEFSRWGVTVNMYTLQTLKYWEKVLKVLIVNCEVRPLCATSLRSSHLSSHPASDDSPLFVSSGGVPVTYPSVMSFLKRKYICISKDPSAVGLHSLRRGGAHS